MESAFQQRWSQSLACLRDARVAMKDRRFDDAFASYTKAHDLGDDHVMCHARGHLGRARVEIRQLKFRDASIDALFAIMAVLVSPLRRLRGIRGAGFAK